MKLFLRNSVLFYYTIILEGIIMAFKIGDKVELKSGSPTMVIKDLLEDIAVCNWFVGNDAKQANFHIDQLTEVGENRKLPKSQAVPSRPKGI